MAAQLTEIDIFFFVIFVFYLTDDQLKDIFNGHQTRDAAKRRAQHFFHAEGFSIAAHKRQQIFGHQNPFDVIFVFADHRETRVGGFDDHIEALVQRLVAFQGNHLRAGDHDVADALVGDIHYPFEHIARIFVDKVVLPGITDQRQQFITVFRFPVKKLAE